MLAHLSVPLTSLARAAKIHGIKNEQASTLASQEYQLENHRVTLDHSEVTSVDVEFDNSRISYRDIGNGHYQVDFEIQMNDESIQLDGKYNSLRDIGYICISDDYYEFASIGGLYPRVEDVQGSPNAEVFRVLSVWMAKKESFSCYPIAFPAVDPQPVERNFESDMHHYTISELKTKGEFIPMSGSIYMPEFFSLYLDNGTNIQYSRTGSSISVTLPDGMEIKKNLATDEVTASKPLPSSLLSYLSHNMAYDFLSDLDLRTKLFPALTANHCPLGQYIIDKGTYDSTHGIIEVVEDDVKMALDGRDIILKYNGITVLIQGDKLALTQEASFGAGIQIAHNTLTGDGAAMTLSDARMITMPDVLLCSKGRLECDFVFGSHLSRPYSFLLNTDRLFSDPNYIREYFSTV